MATTTPNYGWTVPTSTDLVKNGATAISTLGNAADATVFANAAASIAKTIVDVKGDLIAATAADTVSRLAVGANDTVLTADSTAATGLKWASVPSGGMTLLASGTLSGTSVSLTSISQSYNNLIIYVRNWYNTSGNNDLVLGVNSNNVSMSIEQQNNAGTYQVQTQTQHYVVFNTPTVATNAHAYIVIPDYTSANVALGQSWAYVKASNTTQSQRVVSSAWPATVAAITSVQLSCPAGFSGGTYQLWGQK